MKKKKRVEFLQLRGYNRFPDDGGFLRWTGHDVGRDEPGRDVHRVGLDVLLEGFLLGGSKRWGVGRRNVPSENVVVWWFSDTFCHKIQSMLFCSLILGEKVLDTLETGKGRQGKQLFAELGI